ncbi:hypothetical protein BASA62_006643 [Batrachochytrium salamandrivorans]|nr:hypothetical protein BASA62_006643 [Batrachochytrium salamandrivorans]
MQSNICTLKPETFFGEYVKPDGYAATGACNIYTVLLTFVYTDRPAITAAQTLRRKLKGQQHRSFLVLEVFFKQEAAFLFKAQHPQATLSIFSFEDDPKNTGRRKYLVTSISDFWIRYKDMAKSQRHYYELIESGTPCHLYFDIEYDKTCNPGLDGDAALDAFQNYICKRLGDACAIDPKSICTIDLTSTTDVKFSRHLIMRVPGFAFQDNVHAGGFVARIVSDLTALREHYLDHQLKEPKQASSLMGLDTLLPVDPCIFLGFVFNAEGAVQFFVDMGVYTRNRNFRLWRSSKLAKKVELVASPRCLITDDEQGFRKTLVSYVDSGARFLSYSGNISKQSHCPNNQDLSHTNIARYNNSSTSSLCNAQLEECSFLSRSFPHLERFLLWKIDSLYPSTTRAFIRKTIYIPSANQVKFSIANNRYCHNIGREHQSNGVYYVFNLIDCLFFQRCYDPDCRHFQSKEFPFPLDLSPLIDANALMEDEESHSCVEKRNQYEYTEEILDETILEALESDRTQFWG